MSVDTATLSHVYADLKAEFDRLTPALRGKYPEVAQILQDGPKFGGDPGADYVPADKITPGEISAWVADTVPDDRRTETQRILKKMRDHLDEQYPKQREDGRDDANNRRREVSERIKKDKDRKHKAAEGREETKHHIRGDPDPVLYHFSNQRSKSTRASRLRDAKIHRDLKKRAPKLHT